MEIRRFAFKSVDEETLPCHFLLLMNRHRYELWGISIGEGGDTRLWGDIETLFPSMHLDVGPKLGESAQ